MAKQMVFESDAREAILRGVDKLAKAVTVAAREGGGDTETNFTLRLAIEKARAANMPTASISST